MPPDLLLRCALDHAVRGWPVLWSSASTPDAGRGIACHVGEPGIADGTGVLAVFAGHPGARLPIHT